MQKRPRGRVSQAWIKWIGYAKKYKHKSYKSVRFSLSCLDPADAHLRWSQHRDHILGARTQISHGRTSPKACLTGHLSYQSVPKIHKLARKVKSLASLLTARRDLHDIHTTLHLLAHRSALSEATQRYAAHLRLLYVPSHIILRPASDRRIPRSRSRLLVGLTSNPDHTRTGPFVVSPQGFSASRRAQRKI